MGKHFFCGGATPLLRQLEELLRPKNPLSITNRALFLQSSGDCEVIHILVTKPFRPRMSYPPSVPTEQEG